MHCAFLPFFNQSHLLTVCYSQLIFKKLYKNSGHEHVTLDVKHFEDCEQLFLTVGKCFTVLALVHFFNMENKDGRPTKNRPPYYMLEVGDTKEEYYLSVLDRFIDEFLLLPTPELGDEDDQCSSHGGDDFVKNYSLCLIKYFFIFLDLKE